MPESTTAMTTAIEASTNPATAEPTGRTDSAPSAAGADVQDLIEDVSIDGMCGVY